MVLPVVALDADLEGPLVGADSALRGCRDLRRDRCETVELCPTILIIQQVGS